MTDLKILKYKRGNLKARVTQCENFYIKVQEEPNYLFTKNYKNECEGRLKRLEPLLENFEEVQVEINMLQGDEDLEEIMAFETQYFRVLGKLQSLLNEYNNSSTSAINSNTEKTRLDNIKLPTISLPKFDGNFENWLEFRDTFELMIHSSTNINAIQKYHYLRASLVGSATQIISSIPVCEANYNIAWDLICNRYNNKKMLISHHIKSLFNLVQISNVTSTSLRELLDETSKHLRTLENLQVATDQWDLLIIHLICDKLDSETVTKWEEYSVNIKQPCMTDMDEFINIRVELLKNIESRCPKFCEKSQNYKNAKHSVKTFIASNHKCIVCEGSHKLYQCDKFQNLTPQLRYEKVKELNICINCLRGGHFTKNCTSSSCRKCNNKHNTLLHFDQSEVVVDQPKPQISMTNHNLVDGFQDILLSTAMIHVLDKKGHTHDCKILLDSGSQSNFMTSSFCKKLGLTTEQVELSVSGINQMSTTLNKRCQIRLQSRVNSYNTSIFCFVLPEICNSTPSTLIDISKLEIPSHLKLADPNFNKPSRVDMLIGAELFWQLVCIGQISLGNNLPTLQKTKFGWVVSGGVVSKSTKKIFCNLNHISDIHDNLKRFWEIEECENIRVLSDEEKSCEDHYVSNTKRDETGRFIVAIPFKKPVENLGESYNIALTRFRSLQRKLKSNPVLKQMYCQFMMEYQSLGHMTKITKDSGHPICFLPHHGVLKENSLTTKLRVVFDGSSSTSTGISLNDIQMPGPSLQNDLFSILIRFRQYKFVVSADIAKMYRQILVQPNDQLTQCILWQQDTDKLHDMELIPSIYKLNTVTYGTTSAPFLAIRCLKQLALENMSTLPQAATIIQNDFYVDDLLTGFDCVNVAINVCNQVDNILKQSGFELRKWNSNCNDIVNNISNTNNLVNLLDIGPIETCKTLGLFWDSISDTLTYQINISNSSKSVTKRSILSCISQIYDPLGLLGACTITAKIILQAIWVEGVSWDESIPLGLHHRWITFQNELIQLNGIKINRHIICKNPIKIELHGFSDASEHAYGACIYIKSYDNEGNILIKLVSAKSKVAPLKRLSIPRLELCGALLLSKLSKQIIISLSLNFDSITLWCDSTIVLSWIRTPINLLKTFVANRISKIQILTNNWNWQYVCSKDNPADLISRGLSPISLKTSSLWWDGPTWLSGFPSNSSSLDFVMSQDISELKSNNCSFVITPTVDPMPINKFSTYNKLRRCVAYCYRFVNNCKCSKQNRIFMSLSVEELNLSVLVIIRLIQKQSFQKEYRSLKDDKSLHEGSKIICLNPFMDSNNIIRVGGRLIHSNLSFDGKHPILLPKNHHFTKLLFEHEHIQLKHAGPQQLLFSIREKFWPISGRSIARQVVHKCIRCFRVKPKNFIPKMGDLPKERVVPSVPFAITGVDYAGPFSIKQRMGRKAKVCKGYISLFVCFTTKAIHLELVSDLTTENFIAALRRFVSRRGKPYELRSDNGTNFVGAKKELVELGKFLTNNQKTLVELIHNESINWKFIPPYSPHFGGIWEAGVNRVKSHLKRTMGNANLTFEEFNTLLIQIESILNSRPLSPMSSNPNDLEPLTPAHFLIGRSLTSVADADVTLIPDNRLSIYQRIQQMKQHFWKRWSKEYLSELQIRYKNKTSLTDIRLDTLVLLKEDNLQPLQWKLARVVQLHPGPDNHVRVVTVRTSTGTFRRAVAKLCPLPT